MMVTRTVTLGWFTLARLTTSAFCTSVCGSSWRCCCPNIALDDYMQVGKDDLHDAGLHDSARSMSFPTDVAVPAALALADPLADGESPKHVCQHTAPFMSSSGDTSALAMELVAPRFAEFAVQSETIMLDWQAPVMNQVGKQTA